MNKGFSRNMSINDIAVLIISFCLGICSIIMAIGLVVIEFRKLSDQHTEKQIERSIK